MKRLPTIKNGELVRFVDWNGKTRVGTIQYTMTETRYTGSPQLADYVVPSVIEVRMLFHPMPTAKELRALKPKPHKHKFDALKKNLATGNWDWYCDCGANRDYTLSKGTQEDES